MPSAWETKKEEACQLAEKGKEKQLTPCVRALLALDRKRTLAEVRECAEKHPNTLPPLYLAQICNCVAEDNKMYLYFKEKEVYYLALAKNIKRLSGAANVLCEAALSRAKACVLEPTHLQNNPLFVGVLAGLIAEKAKDDKTWEEWKIHQGNAFALAEYTDGLARCAGDFVEGLRRANVISQVENPNNQALFRAMLAGNLADIANSDRDWADWVREQARLLAMANHRPALTACVADFFTHAARIPYVIEIARKDALNAEEPPLYRAELAGALAGYEKSKANRFRWKKEETYLHALLRHLPGLTICGKELLALDLKGAEAAAEHHLEDNPLFSGMIFSLSAESVKDEKAWLALKKKQIYAYGKAKYIEGLLACSREWIRHGLDVAQDEALDRENRANNPLYSAFVCGALADYWHGDERFWKREKAYCLFLAKDENELAPCLDKIVELEQKANKEKKFDRISVLHHILIEFLSDDERCVNRPLALNRLLMGAKSKPELWNLRIPYKNSDYSLLAFMLVQLQQHDADEAEPAEQKQLLETLTEAVNSCPATAWLKGYIHEGQLMDTPLHALVLFSKNDPNFESIQCLRSLAIAQAPQAAWDERPLGRITVREVLGHVEQSQLEENIEHRERQQFLRDRAYRAAALSFRRSMNGYMRAFLKEYPDAAERDVMDEHTLKENPFYCAWLAGLIADIRYPNSLDNWAVWKQRSTYAFALLSDQGRRLSACAEQFVNGAPLLAEAEALNPEHRQNNPRYCALLCARFADYYAARGQPNEVLRWKKQEVICLGLAGEQQMLTAALYKLEESELRAMAQHARETLDLEKHALYYATLCNTIFHYGSPDALDWLEQATYYVSFTPYLSRVRGCADRLILLQSAKVETALRAENQQANPIYCAYVLIAYMLRYPAQMTQELKDDTLRCVRLAKDYSERLVCQPWGTERKNIIENEYNVLVTQLLPPPDYHLLITSRNASTAKPEALTEDKSQDYNTRRNNLFTLATEVSKQEDFGQLVRQAAEFVRDFREPATTEAENQENRQNNPLYCGFLYEALACIEKEDQQASRVYRQKALDAFLSAKTAAEVNVSVRLSVLQKLYTDYRQRIIEKYQTIGLVYIVAREKHYENKFFEQSRQKKDGSWAAQPTPEFR